MPRARDHPWHPESFGWRRRDTGRGGSDAPLDAVQDVLEDRPFEPVAGALQQPAFEGALGIEPGPLRPGDPAAIDAHLLLVGRLAGGPMGGLAAGSPGGLAAEHQPRTSE